MQNNPIKTAKLSYAPGIRYDNQAAGTVTLTNSELTFAPNKAELPRVSIPLSSITKCIVHDTGFTVMTAQEKHKFFSPKAAGAEMQTAQDEASWGVPLPNRSSAMTDRPGWIQAFKSVGVKVADYGGPKLIVMLSALMAVLIIVGVFGVAFYQAVIKGQP